MRRIESDEGLARSMVWVWAAALTCFVLAALTGAWYRLAIISGSTLGFSLTNIRHAHSHLMYFGWITPVLMAAVVSFRPGVFEMRFVDRVIGATLMAAAASYPMFLIFGYSLISIGSAEMPLAVIVSSLNMVAWYAFTWHYVKRTRGLERDRGLLLFDLALTFLVLSTIGAWALALLKPLGVQSDVWSSALTHIFLDLFSEGWFVLGILAMMYSMARPRLRSGHWSMWLICAGLPVTFALGMPRALVPQSLATLAATGSLLVGVGLLANVVILLRLTPERLPRWMWLLPLALLGAKSISQIIVAATPGIWWTSIPGLRILYLHVMLLGFASLATIAVARCLWGRTWTRFAAPFAVAVFLLLVSLVLLTPLVPEAWQGRWTFEVAAFVAPMPGMVVAAMLFAGLYSRRPVAQ